MNNKNQSNYLKLTFLNKILLNIISNGSSISRIISSMSQHQTFILEKQFNSFVIIILISQIKQEFSKRRGRIDKKKIN